MAHFNPKQRCWCGKVCFTKREAQEKRNEIMDSGREKLIRIYQCDHGDWWHLTSKKRKRS